MNRKKFIFLYWYLYVENWTIQNTSKIFLNIKLLSSHKYIHIIDIIKMQYCTKKLAVHIHALT